jgi:FAD/FMN-containing dehydrogenase
MPNKILFEKLATLLDGDVLIDDATCKTYSRDASIFEITPQVVVYPKHTKDVQAVVRFVQEHKKEFPKLSITARSAGTDMSGGPINDSIILDFTKYINTIIEVGATQATVEPGCYYRDFEKAVGALGSMLPSYTASKELCTVGGMVANNSGGEKTIKFGKTARYVQKLKVVFTDGNVYEISPLTKSELEIKTQGATFEANLYKTLLSLVCENEEVLKKAKPNVSKNSAGYALWDIWDEETQTFDLCKLITGSQGTLGIITEITFSLVSLEKYSNVVAIFMPSLEKLGDIVRDIAILKPDSFESYDDYSMKLAVRFFFDFFKYLGFVETIKLGFRFLPEAKMILTGGIPKLTLLVEFAGNSEPEIQQQLENVASIASKYSLKSHIAKNNKEAEKYWKIRRESFNMLRKHMTGKRTAPFIDDLIVRPEYMAAFLPKLQALLKEYNLTYTIAGHAGDGNFHIIPLMNLALPETRDIILEFSKKVYDLIHFYSGSITAEHNDGIIRTPFLFQMFGTNVCELFKQTKEIFDPLYILNPRKKVGGTFDDIKKFIRTGNN